MEVIKKTIQVKSNRENIQHSINFPKTADSRIVKQYSVSEHQDSIQISLIEKLDRS